MGFRVYIFSSNPKSLVKNQNQSSETPKLGYFLVFSSLATFVCGKNCFRDLLESQPFYKERSQEKGYATN